MFLLAWQVLQRTFAEFTNDREPNSRDSTESPGFSGSNGFGIGFALESAGRREM
jgi:hypothetical protein